MRSSAFEWGWFAGALSRRRGIVVMTILAMAAVGVASYYAWPRTYHATFSLELLQEGGAPAGAPGEVDRLRELLFAPKGDVGSEYTTMLRRHDVIRDALQFAALVNDSTPPDVADLLVYRLRGQIEIEHEPGTPLMTVYVSAESPEKAEKLASGLLQALEMAEEISRTERLIKTRKNLEKTRDDARQRLEEKKSLVQYFEEVDKVERRIAELRATIELNEKNLDKEIANREAKRAALLDRFTEDWFEVRDINRELKFFESFRAKEEPGESDPEIPDALKEWRYTFRTLKETLAGKMEEFDRVMLAAWGQAGSQYEDLSALQAVLAREAQNLISLNRDIVRYQNSEAASAQRHRTIKEPVAPSKASSPDNLKIAGFFGLAALALAAILVYWREMTDPTAHTLQEVQQVTQMDALTLIPHMDGRLPTSEGFPLAYGARGEALPPAEAFRTLKTNILFSIPKVPCPVILLTSADREEGKSTTALNLALALAEDRKTLLLSCNMRRPTLHRPLGVSEMRGMAEILGDENVKWDQAVRQTRYPNLFFIPHGRIAENSSVLLSRPAFGRLLEEARREFDAILIDSPPSTLLIDSAVIATKADAVILVYALGETEKDQLRRALQVLRKVDANILGVAVNHKRPAMQAGRRYYYYHHQET